MAVKAQSTISLASVKTVNDASQYALQKAEEAEASANDAKTSADEANTQATYATSYANNALNQLSVVENVVGVLDLLSKHGTYVLTTDEDVETGKWYFTRSGYAGGSYSGSIATFETTAGDNIESLMADIEPIQAGSGDPSPSNVRPISGRTEVKTIVSPTTSETDGRTYTTSLGRTVYGGTLDVVSGVLTVDRAMVTLDGTERYWFAVDNHNKIYDVVFTDMTLKGVHQSTDIDTNMGFTPTAYSYSTLDNTNYGICVRANETAQWRIYVKTENTTLASLKSWLASNPLQIVYPLATPQTYQLTPQQVATLLSVNNLWASSGNVSVTVRSTYSYSVVNNPTGDPHAQGWCELIGIDEAVTNYVSSHLALTDDGLSLQQDGSDYRILISTDGLKIIGANGATVASYGTDTIIGNQTGFHVKIDGTELGFYQGAQRVAYINNNQLYITQSVVLQQMDLGTPVASGGLGQWSWKVHPNGQNPSRNNLNLKWIG